MKTFIVAYMDYFDNDLTQTKVEAETIEEAVLSRLGIKGYDTSDWTKMRYHEIKDEAFNCDSLVSAYELD